MDDHGSGPVVCAVFGGTGFVGHALVRRLLTDGHEVRCLVRDPDAATALAEVGAKLIDGDCLDPQAVRTTLRGASIGFYLVHSLGEAGFADRDRRAAAILAESADAEGVAQLVYLGGLQPDGAVSEHLASRAEVATLLLDGPVPALVLRASMIIGSGSASFELLRRAVHWSPLLPAPAWMDTEIQPIAAGDVLHYLTASVRIPRPVNAAVDIGGPEVLTYRALVQRYARAARLPRRLLLPAPAGPTRLAATAFAGLVQLPARAIEPLLRSLPDEMTCRAETDSPLPAPPGGPTPIDVALRASVAEDDRELALVDERSFRVHTSAERLWDTLLGFGATTSVRGAPVTLVEVLDHLAGGVGLHRGRPPRLAPGDPVDWWRVVAREDRERRLVLEAELRLPGRLRLALAAVAGSHATCRQVLTFWPHGLPGQVWWLAGRPARTRIMDTLAQQITDEAERP